MLASKIPMLVLLLAGLLCGTAFGGTIHAPVATQLTDSGTSADRWWLVADETPGGTTTVTVDVYTEFGGTITINGIATQTVGAGAHSISLEVASGSENYFEFSGGQWNYQPTFHGVSQAYVTEAFNSPNDLVNHGPSQPFIGSNLSLGYGGSDPLFPVPPLETQWFYELAEDDLFSWNAFFDDFPSGDDAAFIEILDPNGVSQGLFSGGDLLGGSGFLFNDVVGTGQDGFWSVVLGAPEEFLNGPGHYLMDVTVNNDPNSDASNRHYLLPAGPPPIPEPATLALLALGVGAGALRRRTV